MSKGNVTMSEVERSRMLVLEKVKAGEMTLGEAAEAMGTSRRHAKRVWRRYREDGAAGLTHKLRGRDGNRSKEPSVRAKALELVREHYADYGPTLAAEKLAAKHGLTVNHETLRRWMKAAGLWERARERRKHRKRRKRRECFGELVQIDGSHHLWFEARGVSCCLMVMIDDATGRRLAILSKEETTDAALMLVKMWIEKYGVPRALYCDRKNVYLNEAGADGKRPPTVFGAACAKLGVEIIAAKSPQAKGRVERANGVFQDRWVKELRELGLSTIDEANAALPAFLDKLNAALEIQPASPKDAHRPADLYDLGAILAREEKRVVSNDAVIRHESRFFQLDSNARPGASAVVRTRLDGKFQIFIGGRELPWTEIPAPAPKVRPSPPVKPRKPNKPSPHHPWRAGLKPKSSPQPGSTPTAEPGLAGAPSPEPSA